MGYMVITTMKAKSEWIDQAKESIRVMQAAGYKDLNEFADNDKKYCGLLLQAYEALGLRIEPGLAERCGMKKVLEDGDF